MTQTDVTVSPMENVTFVLARLHFLPDLCACPETLHHNPTGGPAMEPGSDSGTDGMFHPRTTELLLASKRLVMPPSLAQTSSSHHSHIIFLPLSTIFLFILPNIFLIRSFPSRIPSTTLSAPCLRLSSPGTPQVTINELIILHHARRRCGVAGNVAE